MPEYRLINFNQVSKADIIFTTAQHDSISPLLAKNIIVFSILFSILIFAGCSSIYKTGFFPIPTQEVSGPIVIGPQWIEIIPPKPLIPYGKFQYLRLKFEGYNKFSEMDPEGVMVELEDKRKTKIEAILFDQTGETYELIISGRGDGIILDRRSNTKTEIAPDFPNNQTYTKFKIRSEIPLNCEFIKWIGTNPK
jgi:hypothetical protein